MTTVSFDYKVWDDRKDLLLEQAGNTLGYAAINSELELRRTGENAEIDRDRDLAPIVDGVVGLVAGGLEWLRYFGMSAAEVQSRVAAYKRKGVDSNYQQMMKTLHGIRAIREMADPDNLKGRLDPNKLID